MENSQDPRWLRNTGRVLGMAILVCSVLVTFYVTRRLYHHPRTDDAVVRANVVGVAPHVSGPITRLAIQDNQEVLEGDLLFVVDPRPFEVELERAEARLLLARSEVAAVSNAVAAATTMVGQLELEKAFAADHVQRLAALVEERFVTTDAYEDARTKARVAEAALVRGLQELARQESLLAQFGEVNAHLMMAEAAVHGAKLNLDYCRVRAPFRGRVTNLNISEGEYAQAGQQVFALVDIRTWYVIANFQETYLKHLKTGMPAEVFLLGYPGRRFAGTVEGIGWAVRSSDDSQAGVVPSVNPSLNWVRLAQRIPVRIRLEPPDVDQPYRMGMTAVVTLQDREGSAAEPEVSPHP